MTGLRAARRRRSGPTWWSSSATSTRRWPAPSWRPRPDALVAHVEAGLRSRDWTMPEEINRVVTDRLSDYLFAPSPDAVENLRAEGYRDDQIHLVGNVMIDTLLANLDRAGRATRRPAPGRSRPATVTRSSRCTGRPTSTTTIVLGELVNALGRDRRSSCPLVLPGPSPHGAPAASARARRSPDRVRVDRAARLPRLPRAAGGAPPSCSPTPAACRRRRPRSGVPCLTLRENTERPITVTEGTNRLVGLDPERIVAAAHRRARRTASSRAGRRCGTATPANASPT